MSNTNSTAYKFFGLTCPSGGEFYICDRAETQFIGCCTSNPCTDGKGTCPDGDLRTASFNSDSYDELFKQDCDDPRGTEIWYTCKSNSPPFMGCCDENPCAKQSCARSKLVPAMLSETENNRLKFLQPDGDSSSATASGTDDSKSTATATSSALASASTSAAAGGDEGGLSTGAVAGIAAGATAIGLIVLGFLIWKCWWAPRKRKQDGQQFKPVAPSMHHAGTPGTFFSQQWPMGPYQQSLVSTPNAVSHYPSGVSVDMYGKISPQTASFDRPISTGDVSSVPNRAYGQPYSPVPIIPAQEMDGTTSIPQELGMGQYARNNAPDGVIEGRDQ
ncbi:hypothetical protein B0T10DRAFT_567989 [Thelonectria olida]|uniref:Uncharacterized protein n=1 Tax=Thelonectria olida TaxID=1576542 RepID=A0A9P8VTC9_9HYPO|nr:hypothetical protein B0T10DRAFT_567989 [Thelonectria olida]